MAGAIIVAVIGIVFITLGFLMRKKEKSRCFIVIIMKKWLQMIKRLFVNYQVGVLSLLELVLG